MRRMTTGIGQVILPSGIKWHRLAVMILIVLMIMILMIMIFDVMILIVFLH